jgi:hypothetical protein
MSISFSLNAGQIIARAYRKIGVLARGQVPTSDQTYAGLEALNLMLKAWQADGINLYRQTQLAISIPAGVGMVEIVPQCIGVEDCRWVTNVDTTSQFERPIGRFTYQEYMSLPNKNQAVPSGPSAWMFDRQISESNLWFWPQATNGGQINATVARIANDVNAVTDPVDVPQEWQEGTVYSLADRILDEAGLAGTDPQTASRIGERATAFYAKLLSFDRADSVKMKPWGKRGMGFFWRG